MLRQSARLKTRAPLEPDNLEVDIEPDDDDKEFRVKQSRKRRKITTTTAETSSSVPRLRGNRGKLQQLTEFPLDVLFEIFGHLSPSDVLHLARTTKALRGILMRRSAISVWKQARANDDIPDCPSDLTEPQYANLAFDPHCHFCLVPHVPSVFWGCRIRCCKKCLSENFVDSYGVTGEHHFPLDLSKFLSSCYQMVRQRRRGPSMYNVHQVQAFIEEYRRIEDGTERMQQWIEEKKNALQVRTAHANMCEVWHRQRGFLRSQEINDIRQRRREAILLKLRALGWGEDVDHVDHYGDGGLLSHALVRQGKELTERIWNNIKPTLIEFLQDQKEKRLKTAQRKRLTILGEILHDEGTRSPEIIPGVADIAPMDPFRTVIESSAVVSRECFSKAMKALPQLIRQWKSSKDEELLKCKANNATVLNSASECMENGNSRGGLELATTFFKCSACSDPISYPRILGHEHMSRYQFQHKLQLEDGSTDDLTGMLSSTYQQPWNHGGDRVTFHNLASNAARSIVQACGLNPDTATAREMDDVSPLVECCWCGEHNGTRLVMRWRWAVFHATDVHPKETSLSWLLLSSEDKALAGRQEAQQLYGQILQSYGHQSFDVPTQLTKPSPIIIRPVSPPEAGSP